MTKQLTALLAAALIGAAAHAAHAGLADVTSIWQLDGNLNEQGAGSALTASGFSPVFTQTSIKSRDADVLSLPALPVTEQLIATNDGAVNGGGGATRTNNWTVVMDVHITTFNAFASFINADGGDVDFFARNSNDSIDVGAGNVGVGLVQAAKWYRLAFVAQNDGAGGTVSTSAYFNGTLLGTVSGQPFNATNITLGTSFNLFSDNSGDTSPTLVGAVAYWDEALSAADLRRLGNAYAGGIITTGLFGQNLIVNANAEQDTGNGTGINTVISGWENGATTNESTADAVDTGFNTQLYAGSYSQDAGQVPSQGGSFGSNYLYASETIGDGSVGQTIDVSSIAALIDAAAVEYDAEGYFGGFSGFDPGSMILRFLDGAAAQIGADVTIGGVAVADLMSFNSTSGLLPIGTRAIRVVFFADNTVGANDGAADNLSLVLTQLPISAVPTPAALPAGLALMATATLRRRR